MSRSILNANGERLTFDATDGGEVRVTWFQGHERRVVFLSTTEARDLARVLAETAQEAGGKVAQARVLSSR